MLIYSTQAGRLAVSDFIFTCIRCITGTLINKKSPIEQTLLGAGSLMGQKIFILRSEVLSFQKHVYNLKFS